LKKILILLILVYGQLFALEKESTLKIYNQIFSSLVSKPVVSVYTNDKEYKDVFSYSDKIKLVDTASVADIVLITNRLTLFNVMKERQWMEQLDEKPILFVTDYRLLKYSLDIVGAFYWRKGRSQLLFIKDRLNQYHISLPQEYHAFMVDTL